MVSGYKIGDKVKVTESISTVEGTLYKDEICKVDGTIYPDKDLRLKDSMGRIWYVMEYQVTKM